MAEIDAGTPFQKVPVGKKSGIQATTNGQWNFAFELPIDSNQAYRPLSRQVIEVLTYDLTRERRQELRHTSRPTDSHTRGIVHDTVI